MKTRHYFSIITILFLFALHPLSAELKIGGTYEMELRGNLQKDRKIEIWENEANKTVTIPYGIIDQDHNLYLDFFLMHPDNIYKGSFGLEVDMYNPEGLDYFHDISDIKKKRVTTFLSYVDLNLFNDWFTTHIYKWRGHRESTDLLKLYTSDWDLNTSRYLGTYSPLGIEISAGDDTFLDGLFVAAGQTPALANASTVFIEYMRTFKSVESTLLYRLRTNPYLDMTDPDNLTIYDITKGYVEGTFTRPEFPQTQYVYDEQVVAWDNKVRTYYHVFQLEIAKFDATKNAFYYGAKLDTSPLPYFLNFILMYEKADKYAGNRQEYSVEARVSPIRAIILSAKYDDRKPVTGPLFNNLLTAPLVHEYNREAKIYTAGFIFDPTMPTAISHWNANYMEDAPVAIKCEYSYADYPTYTDNPVYFNWDDDKYIIYGGDKGLYPCKLHKFSTKLISNYLRPYKLIFYFDTGLKQARWPTYVAMVPWTKNYSGYIELRKDDDFLIGFMALMDDWEIPAFGSYDEMWPYKTNPYDYNRDIGIPWDWYIGARVVKFFGISSVELRYQLIIIDGKYDDKYENYMDAFQRSDMLKERMDELSLIYKVRF
ncbi:MAG: hypothetical protein JW827_12350 [Spirochaetes bacterium]|nr:hypothetical protein [Spirochaetota bacterium]